MSSELLECVPNFSEGRDPAILAEIVAAIEATPGSALLAHEMDRDHHRAVVTMAGPPQAVMRAALAAARVAVKRIDLRQHRGVHRRMGAMDVCPFVPIGETSMAIAVQTAHEFAERLGAALDLPVFLYGEACRRPERRPLGAVRNREFEALCAVVGKDPEFDPDHGTDRMHPSAGASAVGARPILVAYNITLRSDRADIAKEIAQRIRERDGGLPGVQALGFLLQGSGLAQVSTNLLDFRRTGLREVFDAVCAVATELGVEVEASELVGLAPAAALDEVIAAHILLPDFDPERRILERCLVKAGVGSSS